MRCLYIDGEGRQCPLHAVDGAEFCDVHLPVPVAEEPAELPRFYRVVRRTFAALMLTVVLLQIYVGLRLLYGW